MKLDFIVKSVEFVELGNLTDGIIFIKKSILSTRFHLLLSVWQNNHSEGLEPSEKDLSCQLEAYFTC